MRAERAETDVLFPANLALVKEARALDVALDHGAAPPGQLGEREATCLYVLARRAAPLGNAVEIGSLRGRSTWYIARGFEDAGSPYRVIAIDPHVEGTERELRANLESRSISHRVDIRVAYSHDLAPGFGERIGLLWIDGDHGYDAVRRDFEDWFPLLAEGGYVAFHDTVNQWYGPTRLAAELLRSRDDLTEAGVFTTITFARKVAPSPGNRRRLVRARLGYALVSLLWKARSGRRPMNALPGER